MQKNTIVLQRLQYLQQLRLEAHSQVSVAFSQIQVTDSVDMSRTAQASVVQISLDKKQLWPLLCRHIQGQHRPL